MSQDIFCTDINNAICDVVGCSAKATENIAVPGGTFGDIKLLLCKNCISKFSDVTRLNNDRSLDETSATIQIHVASGDIGEQK